MIEKTPDKKIKRYSRRGGIQALVLSLIFLKFITVAFEEKHAVLAKERERAQIQRTRTSTLLKTSSGC